MAIIIGKDSENNLIGTNRDDWVFGLGGNDTLSGGNGSDKLFGGNGNDSIAGGAGNDWIVGGKGNDSLAGGSGADQLIGGSGQDHFVYQTATDSPAAAGWDRILDFTQGQDKIDLAAFRNNSSNLDLIWKGEDPAVPGAWGVWYHNGPSSTCVYADTNGDGIADLKIELKNTCGLNLVASDFIGVSEAQMNVAPVLDLDANNSAAVGTNYATTFTENGAPVAIADADVGITDVDDTHIVSASITLTNPQIGDSLVAGALPTGITVGGASTATHIILTGSATLADYQAALKTITFSNSSENPDTTARDVTVVVNDGDANSNTAHTAIAVVAVNDAPISTDDSRTIDEDATTILTLSDFGTYADVELDAIAAVKITTLESNGSLDYDTAGDGSGWTAVTDDQVISAADITAGRLRFVPDANENGTPYTTVGFQVSDGTDFSVAEYTLTLNVTAANDAPTVAGLVVTETSISFVASDVDNATLSLASPFAGAFGNPTITSDAFTALTPAQQAPAVSGTLQVTDDTATANVVRLYLGTNGNDLATLPLAGSPTAIYGFAGADSLAGGTGADSLYGGTGNDVLDGGGTLDTGNDTLLGGPGNDALVQTKGNDSIDGGDDFDTLLFNDGVGGGVNVNLETHVSTHGANVATVTAIENVTGTAGDDTLTGGDSIHTPDVLGNSVTESFRPLGGNDTITGATGNGFITRADYSTSTSAVAVNLGEGTASDGFGGTDTLVRVDQVFGGEGDDLLLGGSQERSNAGIFLEQFRGNRGNDTIDGAGTDTVVGAAGNNQVRYDNSPAAVFVNLGTGTASDGFGGTDTLHNINSVLGSNSNDTLVGGGSDHRLIGGPGNDSLVGGTSGVEAAYQNGITAVVANLATGMASDGQGGTDTLVNIDDLRGSIFNDTLTGNTASNRILGDPGADTIDGGGGIDFASYNSTPLANGGINAFIESGAGAVGDGMGSIDTLTNIEGLIGTHSNDTLTGGEGDQWFIGRGGSDVIKGGAGNDGVSYIDDPAGVTVNLGAPGSATDGWGGVWALGGTDTLNSIENVEGSQFNDSITGDALANRLDGGAGNDTIDGGAGQDTVTGGAGNDTIVMLVTSGNVDEAHGGSNTANGDTLVLSGVVPGDHVVVVNLSLADQVVSIGGTLDDTLTQDGFENLDASGLGSSLNATGSGGANTIIGTNGNDTIFGGGGNDTLDGGGTVDTGNDTLVGGTGNDELRQTQGADRLDGGAGNDRLTFNTGVAYGGVPGTGVNVNLEFGTSDYDTSDAGNPLGTLVSIENVTGTAGNDSLVGGDPTHAPDLLGNGVLESFRPLGGSDTITGATVNGFMTRVDYTTSTSAVAVNLGAGTAIDDFGFIDTLVRVDQAFGGSGADTLIGGGQERASVGRFLEQFLGGPGNDTIDGVGPNAVVGAAGTDRVRYDSSPAAVIVNLGATDFVAGMVTVQGGTAHDGFGFIDTLLNIDEVQGSNSNDTLVGGNSNQVLFGGLGSDLLVGAASGVEAAYTTSTAPVVANLAMGTASDGFGGTDTLVNIDDLRGSDFSDTLTGNAADNRINAGAGADTIDGGGGIDFASYTSTPLANGGINALIENGSGAVNDGMGSFDTLTNIEGLIGTHSDDTLTGGLGDQWFIGHGGSDSIDGGADNDWVSYLDDPAGVTVTLGAPGSATDGWGGIWALGGIDTLNSIENVEGSRFNDSITGDAFANRLEGQGGSDTIQGSAGNDTLAGGLDTDTLSYDDSPGRVIVNMFNNTTIAIGGVSVVPGTAFDGFGTTDTISGFENVIGSAFNDYIRGTSNVANRLEGGAGNDTLAGSGTGDSIVGLMDDTLLGGAGDDVLRQSRGHDSIDGGEGFDRLEFLGNGITYVGITGVSVNLAAGTTSNANTSNLTGGDVAVVNGIEHVLGTAGADSLTGDAFANLLEGGAEDDTLQGGAGDDTIDGGDRNDRIVFSDATGGIGIDFTLVQSSSDTEVDLRDVGLGIDTYRNIEGVVGTSFNDTLTGSSADDRLEGGGGDDTIDGGAGSADRIAFSGASAINFTLNQGINSADSNGLWNTGALPGLGTDFYRNIEGVVGSSGNDTLTGSSGNDLLVGAGGNDSIHGAEGDDTLRGSGGNDTIDGGAGIDQISFSDGTAGLTFTLVQNSLDMPVTVPGRGTDTYRNIEGVIGTEFDDALTGSAGNDVIDGGSGDDTLQGGAGDDTIDGGDRNDRIVFSDATGGIGIDFTLVQSSSDTVVDLSAVGLGIDTYRNIEGVVGTSFNDTLTGSSADDRLEGGGGDDTIDGGAGSADRIAFSGASAINFTLNQGINSADSNGLWNTGALPGLGTDFYRNIEGVVGSSGNDTLTGSSGNDLLVGAGGNDSIHGAEGDDTLRGSGGNDTIDGGAGIDQISFSDGTAGLTFTLVQNSLDMPVTVPGRGTDTYRNIEGVIGTEFDDALAGSGFADVLQGGGGNDTIDGGAGNDTIQGGGGAETMTGSAGIDTFRFDAISDSSAALSFSDVITDFVHGVDKIDLSTIDANTAVDLDQAFVFATLANENTVANSITWSEDVANTRTILQIDNDGDTAADMQIVLHGTGLGLTDADFIL